MARTISPPNCSIVMSATVGSDSRSGREQSTGTAPVFAAAPQPRPSTPSARVPRSRDHSGYLAWNVGQGSRNSPALIAASRIALTISGVIREAGLDRPGRR